MTTVKLNGKPSASASEAVERYADKLYNDNTARIVGVIELKHSVKHTPAPDSEKDKAVELQITGLEIASPEQAEDLRKAMRALYLARTADGTLDIDGELEASRTTLRLLEGSLIDSEFVRLRVGLSHWHDRAREVFRTPNLSADELRLELDRIADGMRRVLDPGVDSDEPNPAADFLRHGVGFQPGFDDGGDKDPDSGEK